MEETVNEVVNPTVPVMPALLAYTDPLLKQVLPAMDLVVEDLPKLEKELVEISNHWNGAGISAIQIGIIKRYFVITLTNSDKTKFEQAYFNPTIEYFSKETEVLEEGCLTRPGLWLKLRRPSVIRVRYTKADGKEYLEECSGMLARVIQHEYDHVNGIQFWQHASKLKMDIALKSLKTDHKKIIKKLSRTGSILLPKEKIRTA